MKLIPLSDFVLEQKETSTIDTAQIDWYDKEISKLDLIRSYTKFLKQPLTLGMFVPCDLDGNILDIPAGFEDYLGNEDSLLYAKDYEYIYEYAEAKEKVLFDGFKIKQRENYFILEDEGGTWLRIRKNNTSLKVEDLLKMFSVNLTPYALEAIGIKE